MYITLEEYTELYEPMEERMFNRLAFDACRVMDIHTTGVDNLKKLKKFFPVDADAVASVKQCAAKLIDTLYQINQAESAAAMGRGYTETDQGLRRQIISRVESGNEAISYSETRIGNTVIDVAASDKKEKDKLLAGIVSEYLGGVDDANGVNLLYMGMYPRRYLC